MYKIGDYVKCDCQPRCRIWGKIINIDDKVYTIQKFNPDSIDKIVRAKLLSNEEVENFHMESL